MRTTLSPHFVLPEVTQNDLIIASICWGYQFRTSMTVWSILNDWQLHPRLRLPDDLEGYPTNNSHLPALWSSEIEHAIRLDDLA